MAYTASDLVLLAHGADKKFWRYDSSTDLMTTISAAGYFANTTILNRMSVGDTILVFASNTQKWLRVTAVSATGSVTTVTLYGDVGTALTIGTTSGATTLSTPSTTLEVPAGVIFLSSSSTQSGQWTVAPPLPGTEIKVFRLTSSTAIFTLHLSTANGTIPTWDGTNDDLSSSLTLQSFFAVGVSTALYGVIANSTEAGATAPMTIA